MDATEVGGLGAAIQGRVEPSVAIAGGTIGGLGVLLGTIALFMNPTTNHEEEAAFAVYDGDLRQRVRIRVGGPRERLAP